MNTRNQLAISGERPVPRLQAVDVGSTVVAPTSFILEAGQCLVVNGPSGAGKTRLLRLLADLDEGEGELFLDGRPRDAIFAPDWRRQVLYQTSESAWWRATVIEHFPPSHREQGVLLAARLGLGADRLTADIAQLSTGERQRSALIRSLLRQPSVLLLDEPSSALDAENIERMEDLLQEQLRGGMSLVLVTHSAAQAARLSNAVINVARR